MPLVLALLICFGSGAALVSAVWPRTIPAAIGMTFPLSLGFGVGCFSVVYFLCRVLGIANLFAADLLVLVLLVTLRFLVRRRFRQAILAAENDDFLPGWLRNTIIATFSIALCAATYNAIVRARTYPQGEGWDAFAIWNLHARFMFRSSANWRDGFTAAIPWSHPDYPLLLPASIAHFWSYLGHESSAMPSFVGLIFTFSTVGLLFSSLKILRGSNAAMLGALALLATPFFIEQGTSQYADVPLAFFFLATAALLSMSDAFEGNTGSKRGPLVLAGISAGFAAWTKNEGLLFLGALLLSYFLVTVRAPRHHPTESESENNSPYWKSLAALIAGTIPALVLIAWFKHSIAPPGDLLLSSNHIIPKLLTASRWWAICQWYMKDFLRFGHWVVLPGTVMLVALYFAAGKMPVRPGTRSARLALLFTLAGYFAVYLITPYDIYWHLRFSLNRLFLQLWPSTIFLLFVALRISPGANSAEPSLNS
jgi:hypothetical protein